MRVRSGLDRLRVGGEWIYRRGRFGRLDDDCISMKFLSEAQHEMKNTNHSDAKFPQETAC